MIESLQMAVEMVMQWYNIIAIILGMLIGVVIGCIPGMTGNMAVALVLPFTFYMAPITALLLLVSLYKGAIYGGSISAILIKTPGTPAAAATVLDGYELSKKGQSGKALYMALYSSCVADFFSNLSLILCTGIIADIALRFGPPEFFALICFSLTIVASVTERSLSKGLLSALLGLICVTIGIDVVHGTERFAFGNADMMVGLNFIPVLIGLFAFPEIIGTVVDPIIENAKATSLDDSRVTWADFKRCFRTIVRGSFIGIILGAIPGIGGAPAAFLSYNEAKRASKHPETFGKGELEGVAASEAGNNGTCGATLIPLLSLGVPGDSITAIILGAFMMHGLTPGPLLFTQERPTLYALYMGIFFSSILMLLSGFFCIKMFSKVANISKRLLFPCVLVLCVYGCYATNNSMFDVLVMFIFGCLGYAFRCWKIPAAPFLIAFILGPLLEDNLRRSLLMSDGSLFILGRSAVCWVFYALTALSLIMIIRRNVKAFAKRKETGA